MRSVVSVLPVVDEVDNPRLVMRDGSVASVRMATSADREAVRRFFRELSPESRRRRFFTAGEPPDDVLDRMCEGTNPSRTISLIVQRHVADDVRPIAIASCLATKDKVAEVAFAVNDHFQGKGLGTALLERLAVLAARHGFERFQ